MVTEAEFEDYKNKYIKIIQDQLKNTGCRPVLFLGSGVTRRYLSGPSWMELLKIVAGKIGLSAEQFQLINKNNDGDPIRIGSQLSKECMEWAFSGGRNSFPKDYFGDGYGKDIFIKHLVADILNDLKPSDPDSEFAEELESFKKISPHAAITTNFDQFLEHCFDNYEVIIGEKIIPFSLSIVAEIYKIHGCVSDIDSMILTGDDYEKFTRRRKYISSKLMTYFAEYPVFIFGYRLNDPNIKSILSDLAEATNGSGGLLGNVFLIRRESDIATLDELQEEFAVSSDGGPSIRIRTIVADDFKWIYDALGDVDNPIRLSAAAMRSFAQRIVDVVSSDIPARKVDVNFARMEDLSDNPDQVLNLLGLTGAVDFDRDYPHLTSELADRLGYPNWQHRSFKIIRDEINTRLGYDVKSSQNAYHGPMRTNRRGSVTPRFSEKYLDLMIEVKAELGL